MNRDELVKLIVEQVHFIVPAPKAPVTDTTDIAKELNLDSLGFVELSVVLEEATDITLDPELLARNPTPGAMADLFVTAAAAAEDR